MTTTTWSVREVPVPTALDAPDAWLLHGLVAAENEVVVDTWGNDDFATTARRTLADLRDQEDTLVHRDHRGHRLGMLAKAVQLQALAGLRPTVRRISTWNAEENSWMLAINVALGFRPAGGSGVWQRRV